MRVLHVVQGYYPAIGGTERVIQRVSEELAARYGDAVTVYTTVAYNNEFFRHSNQPRLPAGTEIINGVTVRRFPVWNHLAGLRWLLANGSYRLRLPLNDRLRALYDGPIIPGLVAAISRANADVIAASSFPLLHMYDALQGGRRAGLPVVFYGGVHAADGYGFDRPMMYGAIRRASAYIAYTSFEQDYLAQQGIPADMVECAGVGVDPAAFAHADGKRLRTRLGWGEAPVVAFVGQQVPHKGIDVVFGAMRQVWTTCPGACLLIAGAATNFTARLEQWIAELPPEMRSRVALLGDFDEAEKPDIFAAADLLAFPSGFESFGIVFLEAWISGKPVIGVRMGAIPSVVDDGRDGILVRYRDTSDLAAAILTLIGNPELRAEMGARGRNKVLTRYTWDIVIDKYRQIYAGAVSGKKEGTRRA